jgi:hypothetical protein
VLTKGWPTERFNYEYYYNLPSDSTAGRFNTNTVGSFPLSSLIVPVSKGNFSNILSGEQKANERFEVLTAVVLKTQVF